MKRLQPQLDPHLDLDVQMLLEDHDRLYAWNVEDLTYRVHAWESLSWRAARSCNRKAATVTLTQHDRWSAVLQAYLGHGLQHSVTVAVELDTPEGRWTS